MSGAGYRHCGVLAAWQRIPHRCVELCSAHQPGLNKVVRSVLMRLCECLSQCSCVYTCVMLGALEKVDDLSDTDRRRNNPRFQPDTFYEVRIPQRDI